MVKLTIDLIARGTSGYTKKKRDESVEVYLKRLTHLYLEDRGIDDIGDDLSLCRNLSVLYLYDNRIAKIPSLGQNQALTHLYLQNNNISKIDGLSHLPRLSKLYIGNNCITVIEGLERLDCLQDLHVEHQKLPPGEQLLFDPRSLAALTHSLQSLNISGNNINSIRDLEGLRMLQQFMANDNKLYDMKELGHLLSSWRHLWRLELMGNALCHKSKYRDRIIVMSNSLEVLDGKEINPTARQFLVNWKATKDAQKKKSLSRQNTILSETNGETKDLPPLSGYAHKRQAPSAGYIMPGLPRKQFDEVLARSASHPSSAVPGLQTSKYNYKELNGPSHRSGGYKERVIGELPDYGLVLKLKERLHKFPHPAP
ncbi:protein phosphatase 1 regulatory subunit 42-like isoform X2 [Lineus longissimus]|uniref:protein phosphatase 1 regulatory subunit 42-like isoform X2 n=1 Tax=Lineus longissimus TaxID=88925 RepID=UPI002B4E8AF5